MKQTALICALLLGAACASLEERTRQRELQSKLIRALNDKTPQFAQCAKSHRLFSALGEDRARVELVLDINSKGQVDKFQIDDKRYPSEFVDCMFQTADSIEFPELDKGEVVQLTQPFIFSK